MEEEFKNCSSDAVLLYCNSEDKVIIKNNGIIEASHWLELLRWWGNGEYIDSEAKEITVRLDTYIQKRGWFKNNWRLKSRKVYLSEQLKIKIKDINQTKVNFEEALKLKPPFPENKLELKNIKRTLTQEQLHNIRSSLSIPSGANFSVPGAGKTTTTLSIWSHLLENDKVNKLLVICPKSAFEAWLETEPKDTFKIAPKTQLFEKGIIRSDIKILVLNYEKLENQENLDKIYSWMSMNKVMMVLDEAHRVKGGGNSIRWQACKKLSNKAVRIELLTGTPMPQGYSDLKNLFNLSWNKLPNNYLTEDKIRSISPGTVFVRTTKDQLQLPEVNFEEVPITPSSIQSQIYSALKRSYIGSFSLSFSNRQYLAKKGAAVMSMIAACTNPGLLAGRHVEEAYLGFNWPPNEIADNGNLMDAINNYVSYEIPPKYEWIIKFILKSSKEQKKTIIWSNLVGNLTALHKFLQKFNPALVYGGIEMDQRKIEIEKFRNNSNCYVLLTNPQTLGEGISFHHECHQAIYVDRTYNAGQYLQSLDRIHRLGIPQNTKTSIFVLNTENSIDNRISSRLRNKIDLMADVLNDNSLKKVFDFNLYDFEEQSYDIGLNKIDLDDLLNHLNE